MAQSAEKGEDSTPAEAENDLSLTKVAEHCLYGWDSEELFIEEAPQVEMKIRSLLKQDHNIHEIAQEFRNYLEDERKKVEGNDGNYVLIEIIEAFEVPEYE